VDCPQALPPRFEEPARQVVGGTWAGPMDPVRVPVKAWQLSLQAHSASPLCSGFPPIVRSSARPPRFPIRRSAMGSATATSVIWVGHGSPSLEFGAERPARRHDHCRAPNRWAPCSTGMPLPSVEPATPPTDCGSPQTRAVAAVHGPQQERQTAARRSGLEPRTDRSPRSHPHGCAGMSVSSAMAVHGADHVLRNCRLRDFESELQQLAVDPRSAHNGFSLLIRRIRLRSSCSILGLPGRPCGGRLRIMLS
jgi:hypothetical protein